RLRDGVRGVHRPGVGQAHAAGGGEDGGRDGGRETGGHPTARGRGGHRPPRSSRSGTEVGPASSSAGATGASPGWSGSGEEEMTRPARRGSVRRKAAPS